MTVHVNAATMSALEGVVSRLYVVRNADGREPIVNRCRVVSDGRVQFIRKITEAETV